MDARGGGEEERRLYWTRKMDEAYAFMCAIQEYPVAECGEPLVALPEAARAAGVTMLFSPLPHVRGLPRLYFLREGIVADLMAAAAEMNGRGWALKIEDAYRTREMQKYNAARPEIFSAILAKTRWELGGEAPSIPLVRRRLAALIAMSPQVGTHCCGSAVDVSVFRLDGTGEVDRGAPYLEMSEMTPMDSPFVSEEARGMRAEITAVMARHGFCTYSFEFWHYNKGDAYDEYMAKSGKPTRYGPVDLDPATGVVTPIANAAAALSSDEEIAELVSRTLERS